MSKAVMHIEVVLIIVIASLFCLGLGWMLGSRSKVGAVTDARGEGRAESAIELARLTERANFFERTLQEERQRTSVLETAVQRADARALSAETELARLQERVSTIADLEQARASAESRAAESLKLLSQQRELASRLTAQVEAGAKSLQESQQRTAEITVIDDGLRRTVADRDSELMTQREAVSRLRTQLEAATSQESQHRQRIEAFEALERTLRCQVSERESSVS
jgi:chromosome segregation ATPase